MGRDQFRVTALQLPRMHCKIFVYKRFCEPQIVEESGDGSKDVEEKRSLFEEENGHLSCSV